MKKKTKNIIVSAITCMISVCLMMFGVYAASNPSVSINGQISYTARDAKVLVQGYVTNNNDETAYPTVVNALSPQEIEKVLSDKANPSTTYLDFTAGTGNSEDDNLSTWNIGTINFYEDNVGVRPIVVNFKLTNLSTYPVMATLTPSTIETDSNVNRDINEATQVYLAPTNGSQEIAVTYTVADDSKQVNADNLLNMEIKFEKTALKIVENSVSEINKNSGVVKMGTYTDSENLTKDVEWSCFAYSNDGTSWTKLESGQSIPVEAKYAYFVMDYAVWSDIDTNNYGALRSKYSTTESENVGKATYYKVEEGLEKVSKNDYYWSEARKVLKQIEITFNIDTSSDLYKAVKGRSMTDLYKELCWSSGNRVSAAVPDADGTDMNEKDAFWMLSNKEYSDLLNDGFGMSEIFWLRSGNVSAHYEADTVNWRDSSYYVWYEYCLMPAFMLELA